MSKWTFLLAIFLITLFFAGAGLTAAWWDGPAVAAPAGEGWVRSVMPHDDGWRRTSIGWERIENLLPPPAASPSLQYWRRIHPGLIAALQILLATGSLLACRQERD